MKENSNSVLNIYIQTFDLGRVFDMRIVCIENFRLIDRNKAGGDAVFECNNRQIKAELIFYLQANECLGIRLGRHDKTVSTDDLEEYISKKRIELRKMVKPDVIRVREERRARMNIEQE